jgi:hypothetical protein
MDLPKADDLRALLAAARESGISSLKITPEGGLEVTFAPVEFQSVGSRLIEEVNRAAPIPEDPLDVIRREVGAGNKLPPADMLDVLAAGGRFMSVTSGDPTQGS